ncbi:hypothetical protein [Aliamphritea hakodatensis]|uniref:hypothetical protein n=1 Tax=Aliamphritea hakodatensis TaxID=2895352 RepID=UPI0022FD9F90|nr:hypothetical protein [Aliamphritea hakodatensis]
MSNYEQDYVEFSEMRSRADSIANAAFLLSGGALVVSVSNMIEAKKQNMITDEVAQLVSASWQYFAYAIIMFVVLKAYLVFFSFLRHQISEDSFQRLVNFLNLIGWLIGIVGLYCFFQGLLKMVSAAQLIVVM